MKEYTPELIRNIGFFGHANAGKTTFNELALYTGGETTRIGKIEEGNTISDYTPNEIERKISISLSACHLDWKDVKLNIVDIPGTSDFEGEVLAGAKVVDTGLIFIKAVEGIEVGTEHAWEYLKEDNKPAAIVINKIDHERSDFKRIFEQSIDRLSHSCVVVTFPAKEGLQFDTVVDVLKMKAYQYGAIGTKSVTEIDIPADLKALAEEYHTQLIEKVAEADEELMNNYFENGDLTPEEATKGLKIAIRNGDLVPVFAASAAKGVGMNNILDFAVSYFPAPNDMPPAKGLLGDGKEVEVVCNKNGEPVLFIFKIIAEQHVGELSLFRVYSGTLKPGMDLVNQTSGKPERLNQFFVLNGHNRKDLSSMCAGDIGAVVKLKDSHTNNTLSSKNYSVKIAHIKFPEPSIRGAIIPKAKGDEDKIATCLHALHEEDPSFNVRFDPEIGQTIITGQGQTQLTFAVKRLKERYNVDVDLVQPRIPYRETIKGRVDSVDYRHKKQSGGRGQFAHVFFKMEPQERGKGFEFVDAIVGGAVPGRFIPAVEKGIQEQMVKGVLAGYNVVDVKVTLFDGKFHDVDSDEMSFKLASAQCFKKAFAACKPCLLEPIYEVEVKVPEEFMGDVMSDFTSRRGRILGMESDGHFQILKANVPLSSLYKYSVDLRGITAGRGTHKEKFSFYEEVPKEQEVKIIEEYNKSRLEEE
ncbi:MAG: elongation factor G [Ignavibacteriales bacterium]|nr:elongation factor G [Ignavibacteriales bacterium]MBK8662066.1 elongation factor G [Ignavibacteriales bacterium]